MRNRGSLLHLKVEFGRRLVARVAHVYVCAKRKIGVIQIRESIKSMRQRRSGSQFLLINTQVRDAYTHGSRCWFIRSSRDFPSLYSFFQFRHYPPLFRSRALTSSMCTLLMMLKLEGLRMSKLMFVKKSRIRHWKLVTLFLKTKRF